MTKADEDKEYKDALEFLEEDDEGVAEKSDVDAKQINSEAKELLRINNLALEYKYTLEGKTLNESKGKWEQRNLSKAGNDFIDVTFSMMNSYAEQANLITSKSKDDFYMQYKDSVRKQFVLVRKDRSITANLKSSIMKLFKDKLLNIGDIICNTKGNMEAIVKGLEAKKKEEDWI